MLCNVLPKEKKGAGDRHEDAATISSNKNGTTRGSVRDL